MTNKKILCLDFDGVIHNYTSGWQGPMAIHDGVVPGALEFIIEAVNHFTVSIYSSRSGQWGGIAAMQNFLITNLQQLMGDDAQAVFDQIQWPKEKPPAFLTIDDRAVTFTGVWPEVEALKEFKPWNKK
jgi:hypothetical protein